MYKASRENRTPKDLYTRPHEIMHPTDLPEVCTKMGEGTWASNVAALTGAERVDRPPPFVSSPAPWKRKASHGLACLQNKKAMVYSAPRPMHHNTNLTTTKTKICTRVSETLQTCSKQREVLGETYFHLGPYP